MKDAIERLKAKGPFIDESDLQFAVTAFMDEYPDKINFFCKKAYGDVNDVSLSAFKALIEQELKNASIAFVNHKYSLDSLKAYLLSCVRTTALRLANGNKRNVYVCPACSYLGKITTVQVRKKQFVCFECMESANTEEREEIAALHKTFAIHSRKGYRCPDCNEFIAHPNDARTVVSCPYPNCIFTGKLADLDVMSHPRVKANVEVTILDNNNQQNGSTFNRNLKDMISSSSNEGYESFGLNNYTGSSTTDTGLSVRQATAEGYKVLMDVIESQKGSLQFNSNESTLQHKTLMYQAYINIIKQHPEEMIAYLVHQSRNGGLQHKIFQEYATLLEASLPYTYMKGGKPVVIESLLDKNLCVFEGRSEFTTEVLPNFEVENKTQEYYVGGRKGFYCKPFYIGKLESIVDAETGEDLMGKVKQYSFFKIDMDKSVTPGTKVTVNHLRIPPHYQMGGMVYLNRIRRKIVDKVYKVIHGRDRELSR